MIRTGLQIGIFYNSAEWGKEFFNKIIKDFSLDQIDKIVKDKNRYALYFKNGGYIKMIPANTNARGYRLDYAFIQKGIDKEIIETIIKPAIRGCRLFEED